MAGETRGGIRLLLVGSAALLAACGEPTVPDAGAPPYEARLFAGTDTLVYHWSRGRTVSVYVAPGATSGGYDLEGAVDAAMAAWRAVLWFDELDFRRAAAPAQADIVVQDVNEAPLTSDPCSTALGFGCATSFCANEALDSLLVLPLVDGGPGRVKFSIAIDGTRAANDVQFLGVVAHELGHAIGLGGHSPTAGDVMNSVPTVAVPSARDARVLRWVLAQPIDLRP